MQFSKEAQKQKVVTILVSGFTILILAMLTYAFMNNRRCIKAQKQALISLDNKVKRIILSPYDYGNSLVSRETIIDDSATIRKLVAAYRNLPEEQAGNSRLPGQWQVLLTFVKSDGTMVDSYISHNSFSDLVFISTSQKQDGEGLEDFFASRRISRILLERLAVRQKK